MHQKFIEILIEYMIKNINDNNNNNSKGKWKFELMLETSALKLFMVANLHYQLGW